MFTVLIKCSSLGGQRRVGICALNDRIPDTLKSRLTPVKFGPSTTQSSEQTVNSGRFVFLVNTSGLRTKSLSAEAIRGAAKGALGLQGLPQHKWIM